MNDPLQSPPPVSPLAPKAELPDASPSVRTVKRILRETAFIGLTGAVVLGAIWEMGFPTVGWICAAVIWILGDPLLELSRLRR